MNYFALTSYILNAIFIVGIGFCIILVRGALMSNRDSLAGYKRSDLSGRSREEIRRRLLAGGMNAVSPIDVMNLIYTFRSIELGTYNDDDPYIPSSEVGDPYLDLDLDRPDHSGAKQ